MLNATTESNAVCLDGSRGGFYYRAGSPDVWILEMEGGGWCTSLGNCAARAGTDIGTSKHWPPAGCPGMDGGSNGMLSNSCVENPHFCNATGAHLNYCDGASFASVSSPPQKIQRTPKISPQTRTLTPNPKRRTTP